MLATRLTSRLLVDSRFVEVDFLFFYRGFQIPTAGLLVDSRFSLVDTRFVSVDSGFLVVEYWWFQILIGG